MNVDCYPIAALPHISPLFRDYASGREETLRSFYSSYASRNQWMQRPGQIDPQLRQSVVSQLRAQNRDYGAGPATEANLDRLAEGAAAVVTGQQVALFGGPLLTLLKAATAIRLAADASRLGQPHVPVFWLASEDHDFDEINQAIFPTAHGLDTLRLPHNPGPGKPVGNLPLGGAILPVVEELQRCLGENSISQLLTSLYVPTATFASAFAAFLSRIFSEHGLIVIDASTRTFHALAHSTLRAAIEQADELHDALLERSRTLENAGYHAQVLVAGSSSLLFLIDASTGARNALKRVSKDVWSAANRQYSASELIAILEETPERISPNALLRPVMQDTLLPTSAYVGGPAEVAYFAQSDVVYQRILGHATPIVPRFSATLVEPHLARLLHQHQLALTDVFTTENALAQRLGARAMPVEGKRKLAAAGNALDRELKALTSWMAAQDSGLGHAAEVATSKMLYQMSRLRRLSATFELQREQSLRRHAEALCRTLFPKNNLQERVLAGACFLSPLEAPLLDTLVERAQPGDCGHYALLL